MLVVDVAVVSMVAMVMGGWRWEFAVLVLDVAVVVAVLLWWWWLMVTLLWFGLWLWLQWSVLLLLQL